MNQNIDAMDAYIGTLLFLPYQNINIYKYLIIIMFCKQLKMKRRMNVILLNQNLIKSCKS